MGKLFLIPTPVGNLEDITFRAVRLLSETDLILAEDTRKTGILLKHYNISNKLSPFHQFNEHKALQNVVSLLKSSLQIALVTDAGTPGISDPGFLLVRECIKENIEVECLPGATAFVPALVLSGLPSDRFVFEGFLPHKKGRASKLEMLRDQKYTMIFYESPHRLVKTLEQLAEVFGPERRVSVSKEISKMHEETVRGPLSEVLGFFLQKLVKGEFVIVLEGEGF